MSDGLDHVVQACYVFSFRVCDGVFRGLVIRRRDKKYKMKDQRGDTIGEESEKCVQIIRNLNMQ